MTLNMKEKQSKPYFYLKAAILSLAIIVSILWLKDSYRIGIDGQNVRCLPDHKYYVVDLKDKDYDRNDIIAYFSEGLEPHFSDGTMMAKYVRGVAGDKVRIDESGIYVNSRLIESGLALSGRLGKRPEDFYTSYTIPEGQLLMLAPAPESYDGRYWGLIGEHQIAGAVTPFL